MKFYGKLLLFGEYSILYQSQALSIPLKKFSGRFDFLKDNMETDISQSYLNDLLVWLNENNSLFKKYIDLDAYKNDLSNNLYFNCNIPLKYGVGSSGAISAALYHKYSYHKLKRNKILTQDEILFLKDILGNIESYFHKKSSGFDPLVSYINMPLQIINQAIEIINSRNNYFKMFLIDTKKTGSTAENVKAFLEKCKNKQFEKFIKTEYSSLVNDCINSYLQNKDDDFFENLKKLSNYQKEYFFEKFSPEIINLMDIGIKTNDFYLKLCGSGGGGFVLGFFRNKERALKAISKFTYIEI